MKLTHHCCDSAGYSSDFIHPAQCFEQWNLILKGPGFQTADRYITDASGGEIDDPFQADRVFGIDDEFQIGKYIFNFFSVIEPDPAHNHITDAASS